MEVIRMVECPYCESDVEKVCGNCGECPACCECE